MPKKKNSGLGRGLDALFLNNATYEEEKNEMLEALREDFFEISEDDITDEEDSIFITDSDEEESEEDEEIEE